MAVFNQLNSNLYSNIIIIHLTNLAIRRGVQRNFQKKIACTVKHREGHHQQAEENETLKLEFYKWKKENLSGRLPVDVQEH